MKYYFTPFIKRQETLIKWHDLNILKRNLSILNVTEIFHVDGKTELIYSNLDM